MTLTLPKPPEWMGKPPFLKWIAILSALTLLVECGTSYLKTPKEPPVNQTVIAQVNPVVKHEEKVEVPIVTPRKTVKVYPAAAKGLIKLPAEVLGDDSKYVTTTSSIPRTENGQVVTTVLDVTTGETSAYVAPKSSPWFALEHRGYAAVDYGFKRNSSNPVLRLNVREDLVQIKGIHLGITGSLHSDGDYFVGAGGEYRW